ncbi:MAG TPA: hypothetical protein VL593_04180 [Ramlibacter sp.]|jgi:hypothetical protein|nr:hypothetical protein [Ramlibacter sp.]
MDDFQLHIELNSYALQLDGQVVSTLAGGAAALMAGAPAQLREIDIENAIERSEEWLMPFSKSFQRRVLRIRDVTGRVKKTLGGRTSLDLQETEQAFSRACDAVSHRRPVAREAVADLVLLRELAHHGMLVRIQLE